MSLLNAVLKVTISALNVLDIYKALTYSSSSRREKGRKRRTPLEELGKSTILKTHASSPPTLTDRVGSRHRRLLLKQALSLSVVWTIYQGIEPLLDATIAYLLPFYGSLKTLFLLWIFISRSAATFQLVHSCLRPLVKPYESILDAVALGATAVLLNAIFLASLPVSHAMLWLKKAAMVKAVGGTIASAVGWFAPQKDRSVATPHPRSAAARRPALVPPPVKKPRTSSFASSSHTPPQGAIRKQSSNSSIGIRKQPSNSSLATSQRTAAGIGRPSVSAHLAAGRSVSSASSTNGHAPTHVPSRTRTVSAAAAANSATMQALRDLPPPPASRPSQPPPQPPPSGFRPGASGGYAFIPPPAPSTPTQQAPSSSTLFSPVVPGSFAPTPVAPTPLRMPPAAKANTPSSAKTRSSTGDKVTGATIRRGPAFKPVRRSTRASNAAKAKHSSDDDDDESEAEKDEEENGEVAKVVTPSKRRKEQGHSASTRDRTISLPASNAKRQKLQVHEDETSTTSRSRRPSTRANSMEVDAAPTAAAPINGRSARRPPLSAAAKRVAAKNTASGNTSDGGSTTRSGRTTRATATRGRGGAVR